MKTQNQHREFKQYCHVENHAQQCRLGMLQDSDFAGDLEDSKSTSGRIFCILGSQTFVLICWMCKKQTSVSHSSTEAEITSLDAGLRMDRIPALDLWDLVIKVFHSPPKQINKSKGQESSGNLTRNTTVHMKKNPTKHVNLDLNNVGHVSSNVRSFRFGAVLNVFEGNEAVIKKIIKGRSSTVRHVSHTESQATSVPFFEKNPRITGGGRS